MFCKYCGKPLGDDSFCPNCRNENILTKRSTELDRLLSSPTPPTPPTPTLVTPPITELERARKEGYNEGRKIGYNEGLRTGSGNVKSKLVRQFRIVIPVVLSIFVLCITVSSSIANRFGQREGWDNAIASLPTPTITVQPTETATIAPLQFVVKEGDRGEPVKRIQAQLSKLGWNVNIDGQFGSETKQAVIEFQKSNGIEITGEVDIITCCSLLPQLSNEQSGLTEDIIITETTPTVLPVSAETPSTQPNDGTFATDVREGIPTDVPTVDANIATTEEAISDALGSIAGNNQ